MQHGHPSPSASHGRPENLLVIAGPSRSSTTGTHAGRQFASRHGASCFKTSSLFIAGPPHDNVRTQGIYTPCVPGSIIGPAAYLANRVDIKNYASTQEVTRYSPAKLTNIEKLPIFGTPDEDRISTSHIERWNLTLRMSSRRHTRLTNGHSKSLKHHVAMQAIFVAFYNFCRKHETLKGQTPAMVSGLADGVWTVLQLIKMAAEA